MNAPSNAPSMCDPHCEDAMHGRTDGRTNADASSPTAAISPSVTRTPAYGFSPLDSQPCIRRRHSRWTTCQCDPCKLDRFRMGKRRRAGLMDRPNPDEAMATFLRWLEVGYTADWIASAAGIPPRYADGLVQALQQGKRRRMAPVRARQILDVDISRGTRGRAPVIGTTRRIRAMARLGYDGPSIAALAGTSGDTIRTLRAGKQTSRVNSGTHRAIASAYEKVGITPGSNRAARLHAERLGWASPLAWDGIDIDDPAATPDLGESTAVAGGGVAQHVLVENVEDLLDMDLALTTAGCADRLGLSPKSLKRALERAGRLDLRDRLTHNAQEAA